MSTQATKKLPLRIDLYAMGPYAKPFDLATAQSQPVWGVMFGTFQPSEVNEDQVGNPSGWPNRGTPEWAGKAAPFFGARVPVWEICNEPDGQGWQPAAYASFAVASALAIKKAYSAAIVVTGGIYKSTAGVSVPEFTRAIVAEMKRVGRVDAFDAFCVHPYDPMNWNSPSNQWHMTFPYGDRAKGDTMREILDNNGLASVPIISSEYGNAPQFTSQDAQAADIKPKMDMVESGHLLAGFDYRIDASHGGDQVFCLTNPDKTHRLAWDVVANAAKAK
jgi:hypothetical protein